jgi:hypothetical protein
VLELIIATLFFLLTFLIVFGALNKLKIFQNTVNAIVAVVTAFYSLLTFFLFGENVQKVMAWSGIVLLSVFGIALLSIAAKKKE